MSKTKGNKQFNCACIALLKFYVKSLNYSHISTDYTICIFTEANTTLVESWLTDDESFYETKGSELVYNTLKHSSCILVTSNSGLGKTATIRHIAFKLKLEGFEIVPIESPEDIIKYNTRKKQLFLIDDVLGKYELSPTLLEKWERLNEKIISCVETEVVSNKILCTLRLQIALQNRFKNASTILNKMVINLEHESNALSKGEKQTMLMKHLNKNNLENEIETDELEIMCETSYAFPLLCKLVSNDKDRFRNRVTFFKQPLSLFKEELDKMKVENKKLYCILVFGMLLNGSFSISIFDIESNEYDEKIYKIMLTCGLQRNMPKTELEEAALSAIGSYFTKDSTKFRFIHDALDETIGCHFFSFNPTVMFSDCDILFIRDRITVRSNENTIIDIDENIVVILENELNEDHIRPLYYRFLTELQKGRFTSLLMSPLFKNSNFIRIFCNIFDKNMHTLLKMKSSEQRQSSDLSNFRKAVKLLSNIQFKVNKDAISQVIDAEFYRSTLIHWIVAFGCYEFFSYTWNKLTNSEHNLILKRHETFQHIDEPILHLAVLGGSLDIVSELICYGVDINCLSDMSTTPLYLAVKAGSYDMIQLLLKSGAQVNPRSFCQTTVPISITSDKPQIISLILEYDLNQTKLHQAILQNDLEKLRSNIQSENINSKTKSGWTVLHYAVLLNNVEAVTVLFSEELLNNDEFLDDIRREFVCRMPTSQVNVVDNNGHTPVHLAVMYNHIEIVSFLLRKKADVHIRDYLYRTPFHYIQDERAIKLLLNHCPRNKCSKTGRNAMEKNVSSFNTVCFNVTLNTPFRYMFRSFLNVPDMYGNTPLHNVVERCIEDQRRDCINILLKSGANPFLINDMCKSASQLIDRLGDTDAYKHNSAKHKQSIQKTYKAFSILTFILSAFTFALFNYLLFSRESQSEFECVGQLKKSRKVTLLQVTRCHFALLTLTLFGLLSTVTIDTRCVFLSWRWISISVLTGCCFFVLLGAFVYIQLVYKFRYIFHMMLFVICCRLISLVFPSFRYMKQQKIIQRFNWKIYIVTLGFLCLSFTGVIVPIYDYSKENMHVIHTLNMFDVNCTGLNHVNISCTSLVYNITYINGVDFYVQCHNDLSIVSYQDTLTVYELFIDWIERGLISLFWLHTLCAFCFLQCIVIIFKGKLVQGFDNYYCKFVFYLYVEFLCAYALVVS